VNKGVTVVDLLSYANELEAQADQLVSQIQMNHFQLVKMPAT